MSGRRIVITGAPRTGKTHLAAAVASSGVLTRGSDELIVDPLISSLPKDEQWSAVSDRIAIAWFDVPGPWCYEGVAMPRALRKWLGQHPEGKPCDKVLWLSTARQPLTPGQEAMGKGAMRVLGDILPQLHARGVEFEVR